MKKLFFVILIVIIFAASMVVNAQISNLTDRELLIQVDSKLEYVQKTVSRIESNSNETNYELSEIEKRVTKNEINIDNFCTHIQDLCDQWNRLLGLFIIFISGIFIAIFRTWWIKKKV